VAGKEGVDRPGGEEHNPAKNVVGVPQSGEIGVAGDLPLVMRKKINIEKTAEHLERVIPPRENENLGWGGKGSDGREPELSFGGAMGGEEKTTLGATRTGLTVNRQAPTISDEKTKQQKLGVRI